VPTHPIYKRIGELIKTRRKTLQLKQEHLASTLGISRGSLANIETGRQSILVHQLYKFASALKLEPSDLLPPPEKELSATEETTLPLPSDLKSRQKQQVARLFMDIDTNEKLKPEVGHAKNRKG
jgi:transcriptional regulator with XRE-family HTH domain